MVYVFLTDDDDGHGDDDSTRGERLRKREEERAAKRADKRRKLGKKPLEVDKSGGHEGRVKKHANKRRLEVCRRIISMVYNEIGARDHAQMHRYRGRARGRTETETETDGYGREHKRSTTKKPGRLSRWFNK